MGVGHRNIIHTTSLVRRPHTPLMSKRSSGVLGQLSCARKSKISGINLIGPCKMYCVMSTAASKDDSLGIPRWSCLSQTSRLRLLKLL